MFVLSRRRPLNTSFVVDHAFFAHFLAVILRSQAIFCAPWGLELATPVYRIGLADSLWTHRAICFSKHRFNGWIDKVTVSRCDFYIVRFGHNLSNGSCVTLCTSRRTDGRTDGRRSVHQYRALNVLMRYRSIGQSRSEILGNAVIENRIFL